MTQICTTLYIRYKHELQNRLDIFEGDDNAPDQPDPNVAISLLNMLNEHYELVRAFRFAKERLEQAGNQKITLRLLDCNTRHDVQYNLPSSGGDCCYYSG